MSEVTTDILCPAILTFGDAMNGHCLFHEIGYECGGDVEIELEVNPGEMYGSDADGNRGMWIEAYLSFNQILGSCKCGHVVDEESQEVKDRIEAAIADYEWEPQEREYD